MRKWRLRKCGFDAFSRCARRADIATIDFLTATRRTQPASNSMNVCSSIPNTERIHSSEKFTPEGENFMSNNNENNRVLGRVGARELTERELQLVNGAIIRPRCSFDPVTCATDGLCSPPAC